jgi:MFS transporter, SP family, galactose:H+ symporter
MPLVIGVGLAILQQVTGINTVIYYAPTIFEMAGLSSATVSIAATAGVGVVNLIFTIVAKWLVERLGRRPLLLMSLTGMVFALVLLSAAFAASGGRTTATWTNLLGVATGIGLMIYIAAFAVGLGPVFWLLIAEIYPLAVRGTAMSLAALANWGTNWLVSVTFLGLVALLGQSGTFLLYAAIGVLAWVFCLKLVPETKGKTLEEVERLWHTGTDQGDVAPAV